MHNQLMNQSMTYIMNSFNLYNYSIVSIHYLITINIDTCLQLRQSYLTIVPPRSMSVTFCFMFQLLLILNYLKALEAICIYNIFTINQIPYTNVQEYRFILFLLISCNNFIIHDIIYTSQFAHILIQYLSVQNIFIVKH